MALSATGVERRTSEVVKVLVRVSDANGHSLSDLTPDDFVLRVDNTDRPVALWTKALDYFHHSTYTLAFKVHRNVPARPHMIEVRVKPPGARVHYTAAVTY
jgi:hypothetical protein